MNPKPRVTCIQFSATADKTHNQDTVTKLIKNAISQHPDTKIIVLPECYNSPYGVEHFEQYAEQIGNVGDDENSCKSESIKKLLQQAKELNVTIVGGSIPETHNNKLYNTCIVCSKEGKIIAKHRKVHLFDIDVPDGIRFFESEVLTAGDDPTMFEIDNLKIGIGICYDIRFPEYAALLRSKDANLLIYPGAFNTTTGPMHWELLQRARAVDNQCFVVTCSPSRAEGGYPAWGHSTIVSPWGKVVLFLIWQLNLVET